MEYSLKKAEISALLVDLPLDLKRRISSILLKMNVLIAEYSSISEALSDIKRTSPDAVFVYLKDDEIDSFDKKIDITADYEHVPFILALPEAVCRDAEFYEKGVALCFPENLCDEELYFMISIFFRLKKRMDLIVLDESMKMVNESIYRIRRVYRDVILAVTQNKLELILERPELPPVQKEHKLAEIAINDKDDLTLAKNTAEKYAFAEGLDKSRVFDMVVAVSEGVSNVLKHAENGVMSIYSSPEYFRIWISDVGRGINFSDIPKSALFKGYSSKNSLGMGFFIMMELLDKLYIYTHNEGTIIVLEQKKPALFE